MTQNQHTAFACFVLIILYQIIWHTFLKHHPVTKKNMQEMFEMFKDFF